MKSPRTRIPRASKKRLAANGGKTPFLKRSAIRKKPRKPIRKVNPKAKAKRKIAYRKMLAGKEYKAARAEALERSGNRCEHTGKVVMTWTALPGDSGSQVLWQRCFSNLDLHAHHLRYPKSRPLRADDLKILCRFHHEQTEGLKMGKTRMF